ncbi:MAG: type II secretion system protein M [Proteobacteria bacterium]|nr:type II secretion system protein M [Pseudomonadota bacterium]
MKDWYRTLNQKDQKLMLISIVLIALTLFWMLIYKPVESSINKKQSSIAANMKILQWMKDEAGKLDSNIQPQAAIPISSNVTFSSWIDRQLVARNLQNHVSRAEPVDENTTIIWLQNTPFDTVMDWLQDIQKSHAISVNQIDVIATDKTLGLVSVHMTLIN